MGRLTETEITLTLPDGSQRKYPKGTLAKTVVEDIGRRLARDALAVKLDGNILELFRPLTESGEFRVLTWDDEEGKYCYRHTASHILAQALKRLFPEVKLAIGPPIEDGFYYDVDLDQRLSEEDLAAIESEMQAIIKEDLPLERFELPRDQALNLMEERDEPYKLELIRDLPDGEAITFYRQGEFVDLCRGPHVDSTGRIGKVKLLNVAGAYWRGDEKRPMLQRIYGTAFPTEKELNQYLWRIEEAKKRDHRRLGPELDLFHFDDIAPGYAFWHPKGTIIYNQLIEFSRELQAAANYQEVRTPDILKADLWRQSGHWDHYRENMFLMQEDENTIFGAKPMNCPGHALIFRSRTRSYRDLPLRIAEYGHLARYERSGTLHGLLRVRGLVQDDAHLFVREDQIESEVLGCLELVEKVYGETFEMDYDIDLSTRPEKFMGDPALWDQAEAALARALERAGRSFNISPGEGAYYGPKLDFHVTDSLGRRWQCATIQLDYQLPQRFDLTYVGADGQLHRPVMIHRAIIGSLERFIGILIEHYAGAFPTWLSPVQVRIIPVADDFLDYSRQVLTQLSEAAVRADLDDRKEKVGWKIRQGQLEKIPYMLIIGAREVESRQVAVRHRKVGDIGTHSLEKFIENLLEEIKGRHNQPITAFNLR